VRAAGHTDSATVQALSIIEEGGSQQVRMANLATVGSFVVNGVAELQSRLLQERTLRRFAELWPRRFANVTNGVSPRRFIAIANPGLTELITETIGDGWLCDLERLADLEDHLEDAAFRQRWRQVKASNKRRLVDRLAASQELALDPDALFDVHVKRIHEYKRQLLKVLEVVAQYHRLLDEPDRTMMPRTVVFGGKAAPGYTAAKRIVRLIHDVADALADEPKVADRLRIAFVGNFNVTEAERIYPAADVSEQISQAGMEASGTGNMKFALNGAVTVGTLDGANIEIRERSGDEAFFQFGMTVDEVEARLQSGETPADRLAADAELARAVDAIARGRFSPGEPDRHRSLVQALRERDPFFVLADFRSYIDCCDRVSEAYRDGDSWIRRSVLAAARCGWFSSDRSIAEYRDRIWRVRSVKPDEHAGS
jgi:starch phosphorylase